MVDLVSGLSDRPDTIGQLDDYVLEPVRQCIIILLDPGRFLNRLAAGLILILLR